MIIENEHVIALYDVYKELLTPKQREYFEMYYFQDYSLGEIANYLGISRNAIFDQIKKASNSLNELENKMHLFEREKKLLDEIEKYEKEYNIDLEKLKNI